MEINGTVNLTLRDFKLLERRAKLGYKHLGLHKDLLREFSKHLSAIVYDSRLEKEQAQAVIGHVKSLSAALPEVEFRHDTENARIILRLAKPLEDEDDDR